jgi:large subunit ribosomal protein L24
MMKVKKGDLVLVISGKYKGKKGKVLRVLPKEKKIVVENVNVVKKHQKPRGKKQKGEIISVFAPFDISKVKIICPHCQKGVRVGFKIENEKKVRICKKCKTKI